MMTRGQQEGKEFEQGGGGQTWIVAWCWYSRGQQDSKECGGADMDCCLVILPCELISPLKGRHPNKECELITTNHNKCLY